MEVLTYAEFNLWLHHFNHSLSEILEIWGDRLVIGDNEIGLLEEDDYETQMRLPGWLWIREGISMRHNFCLHLNKRN